VWNARAPSSLTVQYCPSHHFLHRYAWHAPVATRQGPMTILVPKVLRAAATSKIEATVQVHPNFLLI
jgi:hypothetical protein